MRSIGLVIALFVAITAGSVARAQTNPTIAAASDLQFALKEVEAAFEADGHPSVDLVFGSSGTLTKQIQDGAPFEMFMSADESYVQELVKAGLTKDDGVLYAVGRVVVFAPTGSPLQPDPELKNLAALLTRGGVTRFAIANPEHAPYGRAAEAVLRKRGLWDRLQPMLILGENVTQAAQFATTGNAVGGIIAHSLALSPALKDRGTFALLPESDHAPLRQRMVRLKKAGAATDAFYAFVQSTKGRTIFTKYGFALPGQ